MKNRNIAVICLVVFIDLIGFGVVIPLLPFYTAALGANGFFTASTLAVYSLMQFIFCPILGRLSDKIGRKPVLLFSLIGSVISYSIYGLAFICTDNHEFIMGLIIISRTLAGIMGANITVAYAYIADNTDLQSRTDAMGKIGAAFGLGFILGPAIGALTCKFGGEGPGLSAAILSLTALILTCFYLTDTKRNKIISQVKFCRADIEYILSNAKFTLILLISFLYFMAFAMMESIFSYFAYKKFSLSAEEIGSIFVYLGIIIALSQGFLVGKIIKKIKEEYLIFIGVILMSLCFFAISYCDDTNLMIILIGGVALAAGFINPILPSLVSKYANASSQGMFQGIFQSINSLARIIGPLLAGYTYISLSTGAPFLYAGLLLILTWFLLIHLLRMQYKQQIN